VFIDPISLLATVLMVALGVGLLLAFVFIGLIKFIQETLGNVTNSIARRLK